LIEVSNLDVDVSFNVSHRTQVPGMAITADPDIGANGNGRLDGLALEPFIELNGIASDIGVSGSSHLHAPTFFENCFAISGSNDKFGHGRSLNGILLCRE
jgi:hypothetical protein